MTFHNRTTKQCRNCGETLPIAAFDRVVTAPDQWKKSCRECVNDPFKHRSARTNERRIALFWSKVDRSAGADGCWLWTASVTARGYGRFAGPEHKQVQTHRFAWTLENGPIPNGMFICHHCDNPPCCNPSHLFLGTATDNNRDTVNKGRWRNGGLRGERIGASKLNEANIRRIRQLRDSGATFVAIAAEFGVTYPTIIAIIRGRTWKHVK